MNECKVTIIVGVYNSSEFLRIGLDSIKNQTWENLEVLLMDDGSTDDSGIICDEYSQKDKRFITIHKTNSGVCDSRNKGLERATGEFVCFMDGDDWLTDDFVEYMMNIINGYNVEMALSDKLFTTRDQNQTVNDSVELWNSEKAIANIIYPYMELGPWNKMYSLKVIREHNIKFPSHWFGETLHFASMVAYYSNKVGVGHRKVYIYRLNNFNSGTTQYNPSYRLLSIENTLKLREMPFYKNKKIKNAVEWHIYTNYFELIKNVIGSNSIKEYNIDYRNAIQYLRGKCFWVLIHSDVNIKQKLKVLFEALFPWLFSIKQIRKQSKL